MKNKFLILFLPFLIGCNGSDVAIKPLSDYSPEVFENLVIADAGFTFNGTTTLHLEMKNYVAKLDNTYFQFDIDINKTLNSNADKYYLQEIKTFTNEKKEVMLPSVIRDYENKGYIGGFHPLFRIDESIINDLKSLYIPSCYNYLLDNMFANLNPATEIYFESKEEAIDFRRNTSIANPMHFNCDFSKLDHYVLYDEHYQENIQRIDRDLRLYDKKVFFSYEDYNPENIDYNIAIHQKLLSIKDEFGKVSFSAQFGRINPDYINDFYIHGVEIYHDSSEDVFEGKAKLKVNVVNNFYGTTQPWVERSHLQDVASLNNRGEYIVDTFYEGEAFYDLDNMQSYEIPQPINQPIEYGFNRLIFHHDGHRLHRPICVGGNQDSYSFTKISDINVCNAFTNRPTSLTSVICKGVDYIHNNHEESLPSTIHWIFTDYNGEYEFRVVNKYNFFKEGAVYDMAISNIIENNYTRHYVLNCLFAKEYN